jgi:membrane fusion protein (multidrug efflux system)
LSLDRTIGDQWLVSTGLSAGDRVIVEGSQKVRPGVTARVVPFDGDAKQEAAPGKTAETAPTSN